MFQCRSQPTGSPSKGARPIAPRPLIKRCFRRLCETSRPGPNCFRSFLPSFLKFSHHGKLTLPECCRDDRNCLMTISWAGKEIPQLENKQIQNYKLCFFCAPIFLLFLQTHHFLDSFINKNTRVVISSFFVRVASHVYFSKKSRCLS